MGRFLRDNGLSVALGVMFLGSIIGQALFGWWADAEDLRVHHGPAIGFAHYLVSGHFLSAVFENWESEFLQMSVYVLLTAVLVQKGSPESKSPDEPSLEEATRLLDPSQEMPWPVRRGGAVLWLYSHSLSIALLTLFLVSFWLHLAGRTLRANDEAALHGRPAQTMAQTLGESEFWYESFQNWQSEFLSMGVLVVLGIWLREKGSPESKPVATPHAKTGR